MNKKILVSTFAAVCILSAVEFIPNINYIANGYDFSKGTGVVYSDEMQYDSNLYYCKVDVFGDGKYEFVKITGCDRSAVFVEIPSEIDGLPVDTIGYYSFDYCESLEKVIIPSSVTCIEEGAFGGCTSLSSITIPDSVKSIGHYAFSESAPFINNQSGVKYAGKWLIGCDASVTSVNIKQGTTGIACCAFRDEENITSMTLPESLSVIGPYAFYGCDNLRKITIPENVSEIGDNAFTDSNLESIVVKSINCEIGWHYTGGMGTPFEIYDFNGTVYGYNNSTAQSFAESHGYKFESLGEIPKVNATIKGDSNGDNKVNVRDAANIAAMLSLNLTDKLPETADFNNDRKINVRDAAAIAKYLAGAK